MELVNELELQKSLFNKGFKKQLTGTEDYPNNLAPYANNYFDKITKYVISNNYIDIDALTLSVDEFLKQIAEYVDNTLIQQDYEKDVKKVKEKKIYDIAYAMDNYLATLEPYDGLNAFLNGDQGKLIKDAMEYYINYKARLINKVNELIDATKLEYDMSETYRNSISSLLMRLEERKSSYDEYCMCMKMEVLDPNAPLVFHEQYIDKVLCESKIINKFSEKARKHILNGFDTTDFVTHESFCSLILINYSILLASFDSDNPESLEVNADIRKKMTNIIKSGQVTTDQLINNIIAGPVEFTEEEIKYIKENFASVIGYSGTYVEKTLYLKII